jgi:hypothetical protein
LILFSLKIFFSIFAKSAEKNSRLNLGLLRKRKIICDLVSKGEKINEKYFHSFLSL